MTLSLTLPCDSIPERSYPRHPDESRIGSRRPDCAYKANVEGIKDLTQKHWLSFTAYMDVGDAYELDLTERDCRANPDIPRQEN